MKECELKTGYGCTYFIHPKKTDNGVVYWENGNDGFPLVDGRVCDACNVEVLKARISQLNRSASE